MSKLLKANGNGAGYVDARATNSDIRSTEYGRICAQRAKVRELEMALERLGLEVAAQRAALAAAAAERDAARAAARDSDERAKVSFTQWFLLVALAWI